MDDVAIRNDPEAQTPRGFLPRERPQRECDVSDLSVFCDRQTLLPLIASNEQEQQTDRAGAHRCDRPGGLGRQICASADTFRERRP
jgi:hypothetical protein